MKASEKTILRFLEGTDKSFIIPIYQRNYDWKKEQCEQLFNDLISVINSNFRNHFFGSIVFIYDENADDEQLIIIDGQQRLTTISLLLLAMYNLIENGIFDDKNDLSIKIRNEYLVDKYKPHDKKIKLKLIKNDKLAFDRLFENNPDYYIQDSKITINYNYFYTWIQERIKNISELYEAIKKLSIVQIKLIQKEDDPQLIFESLNSTGLDLTEADKIRNYVLMGTSIDNQNNLYENYWLKIESLTNNKIDAFARCYLTIKTNVIPNEKRIYLEFKQYVISNKYSIDEILEDMLIYAKFYSYMISGNTDIPQINTIIKNMNFLESTTAYPYTIQALMDYYNDSIMTKDELIELFNILESFLVRRLICNVPTNALNKLFLTLERDIRKNESWSENYINIFKYLLKSKTVSQRFPDDEEFKDSFTARDLYNIKSSKRSYIFEKLENYDNVEQVNVTELIANGTLTIEHIMPQELTKEWKESLGSKYEIIHEQFLHNIGNLTLTGYNAKYSNKSFELKKTMNNGFLDSKLSLNKYVAKQNFWNREQIEQRAKILFDVAIKIWPMVKTDYKPIKDNEDFYTLSDEESFTNKKIQSYVFFGDEIRVKQWTDFYEDVIDKLYELDHGIMQKIVTHNFQDSYMGKRFTSMKNLLRNAHKVDENIYIEKNLNTDAKLDTLRAILDFYELEYSDIGFYIQTTNSKIK